MTLSKSGAVAALVVAATVLASSAIAEPQPGQGSLGGLVGVPVLLGDRDLKDGQSPRLLGQVHFQYVVTPQWRLSTQFGFGWVGYSDGTPTPVLLADGDTPIVPETRYPFFVPGSGDSTRVRDEMLTKFQPIAVTLVRALRPQGTGWSPFVGAGVNLHRVEIVNDRNKVKDPATFDEYVMWSPGVHVLGGAEYFIPANRNVALEWTARYTQLLKRDSERFPSGFTGRHSYLNINFGVNLYFWPIGHKPVEPATAPEPAQDGEPAPEGEAPEGGASGDDQAAVPRAPAPGWQASVLAASPGGALE